MPDKLTESQLQTSLATLPTWKQENGEMTKTVVFQDFRQAIAFVNQLADLAENAGHHPDIDIRYNKVRLGLVTHDSGGITQDDISLATEIDRKLTSK